MPAIVALRDGEPVVREFVERPAARGATCWCPRLRDDPRASQTVEPEGAMYAFFRVEGQRDSLALAKALVRGEQRLGLAPGSAFGPEGEGLPALVLRRTRHAGCCSDGVAAAGAASSAAHR